MRTLAGYLTVGRFGLLQQMLNGYREPGEGNPVVSVIIGASRGDAGQLAS